LIRNGLAVVGAAAIAGALVAAIKATVFLRRQGWTF
jgi:hypothetical protein